MVGQDVFGRLFYEDPEGLFLPAGEAFELASPDVIVKGVKIDEFFATSLDVDHDKVLNVRRDRFPKWIILYDLFETRYRKFTVQFAVRFLQRNVQIYN